MAYEDKTIQCVDCGKEFTFSAEEQELFAQRGYENEPKRGRGRCSLRCAPTAARTPRCRSSRGRTDRSTAGTVTAR